MQQIGQIQWFGWISSLTIRFLKSCWRFCILRNSPTGGAPVTNHVCSQQEFVFVHHFCTFVQSICIAVVLGGIISKVRPTLMTTVARHNLHFGNCGLLKIQKPIFLWSRRARLKMWKWTSITMQTLPSLPPSICLKTLLGNICWLKEVLYYSILYVLELNFSHKKHQFPMCVKQKQGWPKLI